jgi:hypothetical protein
MHLAHKYFFFFFSSESSTVLSLSIYSCTLKNDVNFVCIFLLGCAPSRPFGFYCQKFGIAFCSLLSNVYAICSINIICFLILGYLTIIFFVGHIHTKVNS